MREGIVLPGYVLSAIVAGCLGLLASAMAGHPLLVSVLFYILSGCCGVLAFAWRSAESWASRR